MPTLDELEGTPWPERPSYGSHLVTTCHALRRKPLEQFSVEDLRMMIGQKVGLPQLVPLAVERLLDDPLAEGDFYPGDLLKAVLTVPESLWATKPALRQTLADRLATGGPHPKNLRDLVAAFVGG